MNRQEGMEKKKSGMTPGKLIAWGCRGGSTGIALMIMGYLTIFCTDTLGIPAAVVGSLLLLSKLLDGVTDLFAGVIVDRTRTKWGKGRPYEWCVVGLWISTVLLFMCPASFRLPLKLVWIFIMYAMANSVFMTFLNANGTAYMVRAFSKQKEYVALSTYGGLVPMLIVFAFNIVFPILVGTMATSQGGWITLVGITAVPMIFLGMLRFFVIPETRDIDGNTNEEKVKLRDVFTVLRKNPYIYIIALTTLIFNVITNMGVQVYYFTHIVGNVKLMGVLAAVQVIALPMMFILPAVLKKTTVARVMQAGLIIEVIGWTLNFFAGSDMVLLMIANVLVGGGAVPITMLVGLLIIDCAEYNEYMGMRRLEGTLSAVNGFASKLGAGVGAGLLGILLGLAGYDGKAPEPAAGALTLIRLLYSLIPAALYIVVFLSFLLYKLDRKMPEIREKNRKKRETEENA